MDDSLKDKIRRLALKYEKREFLLADPSKFMHRYESQTDQEIVALVSAALAFGKRSEILAHIEQFLSLMGNMTPSQWLLEKKQDCLLPDSPKSFYRVFSYHSLRLMCDTLASILEEHGSLGNCLKTEYVRGHCAEFPGRLAEMLASHFPKDCSPLISRSHGTANKRLNLFLRWMVRLNSPVDLGLWHWYPASELLIPLDVHVVAVAKDFGLLPPKATPSLKQAILLSDAMREVFPDDPCKGDFALFGLGVDEASSQ